MARVVCMKIPEPPTLLNITIPVIGDLSGVTDVALKAYNACEDARAFIQSIQPALGAFSLPLCILGCVISITEVFTDDFPFVDPVALPAMIEACSCLVSWTPFSFCKTLKDLIIALLRLMRCILGLIGDIVALEARLAALANLDLDSTLLACLTDQQKALLNTVISSFGPFSKFFDSIEFLFTFVGVPFQSLGSIAGDNTAEVVQAINAVIKVLEEIFEAISLVCP